MKSLKNIENQAEIDKEDENNQLSVKSTGYIIKEKLSQEAKNMLNKLSNQEKPINHRKLYFKGGNGADYDYTNFSSLGELLRMIYHGDTSISVAERDQSGFVSLLNQLKVYGPAKPRYVKAEENLLINAKNFYEGRQMVIDAFKNKIFPLDSYDDFPTYVSDRSSISEDSSYGEDESNEMITEKDKFINKELFKRHFTFQNLIDMQKNSV